MADKIVAVVLLAVALLLFVMSIRSFLEKGFLFNNAYLYASKKERAEMNKKPYYRQTAVIFSLMGIVFGVIGIAILLDAGWLTYLASAVIVIILIYSIVSSLSIARNRNQQ